MKQRSSPVQRFVDEWCELGTKYKVPAAELHEAFGQWCAVRKIECPTKAAFGRQLTRLGYESTRDGRKRYRAGLRLARPGAVTAGGTVKIPDVPVMKDGRPQAPEHLSPSTAAWWQDVVEEYNLDEHNIRVLTLACDAWEMAQAAREAVRREGLTVVNTHGNVTARPEVGIAKNAWVTFARLVREMTLEGLDASGAEAPRLPRMQKLKRK